MRLYCVGDDVSDAAFTACSAFVRGLQAKTNAETGENHGAECSRSGARVTMGVQVRSEQAEKVWPALREGLDAVRVPAPVVPVVVEAPRTVPEPSRQSISTPLPRPLLIDNWRISCQQNGRPEDPRRVFAQAERGAEPLTVAQYQRILDAARTVWAAATGDAFDAMPGQLHFEQVVSRRSCEFYLPPELVRPMFDALVEAFTDGGVHDGNDCDAAR